MKIPGAVFPLAISLVFFVRAAFGADACISASCHAAVAGAKNLHQPVKDGDCTPCHQQKEQEHPRAGGKSFALAASGAALCAQCHDPFGKKKVIHSPVKEGDCVSCHKPHGSSGAKLLDVAGDQRDLCLGCHSGTQYRDEKHMHGPAAVGACTACHDPHESGEKGLLKTASRDLCLKCHVDFAKAMQSSPIVHPPVKKGCVSCHTPHGGPLDDLLRKKMPDICIDCHKEMGKKLAAVKVPHQPVSSDKGCGSCHSTHYSQAKGLLPSDEKSACLACHGTDKLGTPPLRNLKKELEGKKYFHGPLAKGRCSPCHNPHGSGNYRILSGNFPNTVYVPYVEGAYQLCLQCHEKNLLKFPDTTLYTKFRNGKRNLHYVHVVARKGRSCVLCHETHAGNGEKLINTEGTKFGEWKVPINFKISETGGSCSPGCHRSVGYDRVTPVKYR